MKKIIGIIVKAADFLIDNTGAVFKKSRLFIKKNFNLSKHTKVKARYKTNKKRLLVDILLAGMTVALLSLAFIFVWAVSLKTPSPESFDDRLLGQSAKIYDRTGKILLYDLSQKVRRTIVPFDKISPYIKNATIAIEDESFYQHKGVQAKSILRAIIANAMSLRFSQGGSTITQQVVKNSLLSTDKSISRKIKEWILSIKLEQVADKDTILNMYLNSSPYGGNIYGVGEATENFFGKKPEEVTLAEAAYIAALPQSPTSLSPYGKNTARLEDRKNAVLKKMLRFNFISQSEFDSAMAEKVVFLPKNLAGIKAAHFVMYIKEYLENKYGEDLLQNSGLKIITTLDYDLQQKAEEVVKNYVISNQTKFKATNGAIVATDPKTGQILVMVGSRDYFDKEISGNFNVATARRQPGSAFKPFVYATAFNQGYLPETPVFDVATEFNSGCTLSGVPISGEAKCYSPQNYEGGYKGLMSFKQALGASRNVPAVKVLYLVGVDTVIKTARAMGIEGLSDANQYGLSLALGGGEVSLLDMTSAFGVFGNGGVKNPQTGILSVTTADGQELESFASKSKLAKQVIPEQTAFTINDVLSDIYARNSIFPLSYTKDRQVAIKTGTTNSSRDAWTIGYTPSISVGAWMGNNDNTPMAQMASALIVSPMWKQFLDYALTKVPEERFEKPTFDTTNKKPYITGSWRDGSGQVHSELYWINRTDPMGPPPSNPNSDPLFNLWETAVLAWAGTEGISVVTPPTQTTPTSTVRFGVSVGPSMFIPKNLQATASVSNYPLGTVKVEYFINGESIGASNQAPFSIFFTPGNVPSIQDENELRAVSFSALGSATETVGFFTTN